MNYNVILAAVFVCCTGQWYHLYSSPGLCSFCVCDTCGVICSCWVGRMIRFGQAGAICLRSRRWLLRSSPTTTWRRSSRTWPRMVYILWIGMTGHIPWCSNSICLRQCMHLLFYVVLKCSATGRIVDLKRRLLFYGWLWLLSSYQSAIEKERTVTIIRWHTCNESSLPKCYLVRLWKMSLFSNLDAHIFEAICVHVLW